MEGGNLVKKKFHQMAEVEKFQASNGIPNCRLYPALVPSGEKPPRTGV